MSAPLAGWPGYVVSPQGGMLVFAIGAALALLFSDQITRAVIEPLCTRLDTAGQGGCAPLYAAPENAPDLRPCQAMLLGLILAIPTLLTQAARLIAPTLRREVPQALLPFAMAGLLLAGLGVAYALLIEAPRAFAAALETLGSLDIALPATGTGTDYARAALGMAGFYAFALQLPVMGLMMLHSARTRRALNDGGRA